ncbi:hypothetical protein GCM10011487_11740 [Steroidobacter agaridevorans]|uniref:Uncharacterized protein n=1 Tax=Steroidobacter agaridevorans TaxID=2695856 RepID=A0A829Y7C9_9GAMM|nr:MULTISPECIES: hypothetical protein [Steroidobacteraceae]GFE79174.1 hypothetical protein GCM10011487_11740 [Steroidobacter agaridevorans]
MTNSYAPEVQCDHSGKWYGNALRFASESEAQKNVRDLASRWTLVHNTRVVPSEDPPNYRWDDTLGLVRITGGDDKHVAPDHTATL